MTRKGQKGKKRRPGGRDEKDAGRLAFGRLKGWMAEHDPSLDVADDPAIREFQAMEPGLLSRWISRLFHEEHTGEPGKILQGALHLLGDEAAPFLQEVVRSEGCSLAERKKALDVLRGMGAGHDEIPGDALDAAWTFVTEEFSVGTQATDGPDPSYADLWERYQRIPKELSGSVACQLLANDPVHAFSFLMFCLEESGELPEEVLEGMVDVQGEEAARFLQAAFQKAGRKKLQKRIKKVNHKRRAKGLPSCDFEAEDTGRAIWSPPVPPKPIGLLSMTESAEARMVWVIRHNVPKGMLVFGGLVHDGQGLVKFFLLDVSPREAEKYRDSLVNGQEPTVVETDPAYCAFLLEDAYGRGAPRDAEEAELYKGYRMFLKELSSTEEVLHPIRQAFQHQADQEVTEDPLGESAALLKHKFLLSWRMDPLRLKPHLGKLEEISESKIIVHPLQKKERIESFYRDTTREMLSDEAFRDTWRRRLEDMAWVLFKTGEDTLAKRLFRVGLYLEDAEKDFSRVAFFTQLVQMTFEGWLKEKKSEEKAAPSLIVKPS